MHHVPLAAAHSFSIASWVMRCPMVTIGRRIGVVHYQVRQLVDRAWEHHRKILSTGIVAEPSAPVLNFGDREAYESSE